MTSPLSNATVSGTIMLQASATDNIAVSNVEFRLDGSLVATDSTSPYAATLDTTKLSDGLHKVSALATDSSGNKSALSEISINVDNAVEPPTTPTDTTAPVVTITSPADGAIISPRTTVAINVKATDDVSMARVEFYATASLICSDNAANYSCSYKLPGAKGASYVILVKGYDGSGNSNQHQITITSSGTSTGTSGGGKGGGKDSGGKK